MLNLDCVIERGGKEIYYDAASLLRLEIPDGNADGNRLAALMVCRKGCDAAPVIEPRSKEFRGRRG